MDAFIALSQKIRDVTDYIYEKATQIITAHNTIDAPIFYASNPPSINDYPDNYVYINLSEGASSRYAMCHGSHTTPMTIVVEVVASLKNADAAREMVRSINYTFTQGLDQYNIITVSQATASNYIKSGIKVATTVNFKFNTQLKA